MTKRKPAQQPPAPYERPRRRGHDYAGGWTYRCCAVKGCGLPPEANVHQH